MSRPKGSKNKKNIVVPADIDEQIAAVGIEIAKMSESVREKKLQLKNLNKLKVIAERQAEEQRAAEQKQKLLDAFEASGKSIDEVLELLK